MNLNNPFLKEAELCFIEPDGLAAFEALVKKVNEGKRDLVGEYQGPTKKPTQDDSAFAHRISIIDANHVCVKYNNLQIKVNDQNKTVLIGDAIAFGKMSYFVTSLALYKSRFYLRTVGKFIGPKFIIRKIVALDIIVSTKKIKT